MDKKTILVTGGAGFIGSHLVRRLLGDGAGVAILAKEGTDTSRLADILPQLTILRDDMSDTERLKKILHEIQPHGVFHCAASNIKSGVAAPEDDLIRANFAGTVHLLEALEEVDYKFFINCGSILEYGTKQQPFKESDICEPLEIYALTKLAGTLYSQAVARSTGKPIVTFRIFTPYGPAMGPGWLAYEVVKRAREHREIMVTSPEVNRDFIAVQDIVELFMEVAGKAQSVKGEIFNLGSGTVTTLKDFVECAMRITNSKSRVQWGGAKGAAYDSGCQQADMTKTFAAFSWRPKYSIDVGIKSMDEWFGTSNRI